MNIKTVAWKLPTIFHRVMKKVTKRQIVVTTCEIAGTNRQIKHWLWTQKTIIHDVECTNGNHFCLYSQWRLNDG